MGCVYCNVMVRPSMPRHGDQEAVTKLMILVFVGKFSLTRVPPPEALKFLKIFAVCSATS